MYEIKVCACVCVQCLFSNVCLLCVQCKGLKAGDRVLAIDGQLLNGADFFM